MSASRYIRGESSERSGVGVGQESGSLEGRVTATLSLSGLKSTVLEGETERSLELIRTAAAEVSGTLGHTG